MIIYLVGFIVSFIFVIAYLVGGSEEEEIEWWFVLMMIPVVNLFVGAITLLAILILDFFPSSNNKR